MRKSRFGPVCITFESRCCFWGFGLFGAEPVAYSGFVKALNDELKDSKVFNGAEGDCRVHW